MARKSMKLGVITMHNSESFLRILQSVDAFFPVGAFTLSNGLEDYVVREHLTDCKDLRNYLKGFMQILPYNDLGIAACAYNNFDHPDTILLLDNIAAASKSASEVRTGTNRMCSRYLKAREAMEDCGGQLGKYRTAIREGSAYGVYPIALGIYGSDIGIELDTLLTMYGYSILSAIVNNAVKLVPLSQLDGQRILYECMREMEKLVNQAKTMSIEKIGVSGAAYEIHCMNHEKLYSRQYSS